MKQINRQLSISNATKQKVQAAKNFIQQRYSKVLQQQKLKRQHWEQLNRKMAELNMPTYQQQELKKKILHQQAQILRRQREKITVADFIPINIIGRGAFGQVRLCRWSKTNQPVAVKKLKKSQMIFKNKVLQSREERNVLANSEKSPWIVKLKCSFQDPDNLYLVMQYLPGGDLMNLLIKKDIFTHQQAQFYTAQILLALESVHKMNYIHRDLKPDNVLIDSDGHIKLSDFGLCKHTEIRPKKLIDFIKKQQQINESLYSNQKSKMNWHRNRNRKLAYTAVGTPDYVAPQVQGKIGYTQTVDWWSMGVILYEMLVGYPPFASQDAGQTWKKIQNWRRYLLLPKDVYVSPAAADLIKKLIADPKDRLGVNGVQQIKAHPFFEGVNWSKLRQKKSPYIPQVKDSWDTHNFDPYQQEQSWIPSSQKKKTKTKKKNTQFIGYTYKPIQQPNSGLLKALLDLETYQYGDNSNTKFRKNALDYLQLQNSSNVYSDGVSNINNNINISININNKFKKQKPQKIVINNLVSSTSNTPTVSTKLYPAKNIDMRKYEDKKYKYYQAERKISGTKIKKQSPALKEREKKESKGKIIQKKYF